MTDRKKFWSYSAGERGRNRVRAYEDTSGKLLLEFYVESDRMSGKRKRKRASLPHRDRDQAKAQADELAARFARQPAPKPAEEISVGELFDIYVREVTPQKGARQREHDLACAEMFARFLGLRIKAKTVNRRDWDRFIRERRDGTIRPVKKHLPDRVGNRTIERDLKWLLAVFNWATLAGDGSGGFLLDRNPLKGLPLPKEQNPRRPIMDEERYESMLGVAGQIDWRFELMLVLAHETGHRIAAIRQLRWSDIDIDARTISWPADTDKMGREHVTPLSARAVVALRQTRQSSRTIGEAWVFPAPRDALVPCSRYVPRDWWYRAEALAGLRHVSGLGWHSFRRKFATDLKTIPVKDLCALGGWKTFETVLECYQQHDQETMRTALEAREATRESGQVTA